MGFAPTHTLSAGAGSVGSAFSIGSVGSAFSIGSIFGLGTACAAISAMSLGGCASPLARI